MNVVNTRTNILYIRGCHTRTNRKENVSCYSCISYHEMNVVKKRTNILYIYGCHTRTNHKKNVSCYSCISHHEMNVVNIRTNIIYTHGCHTRTNHKEIPVVTHLFHNPEIFIVRNTSSIKAKV